MSDVMALARAFDFAALRHARDRRKGAAQWPYVNHLAEVARLLAEATEGRDPVLVMAGLLHDVVEDGNATEQEVVERFGAEVAAVVMEVTDPPGLDDQARKQRQVEHAPHMSPRARMLKLADKTSNVREVLNEPPATWDDARKRTYAEWGRRVADGCRGVNPALEAGFDAVYAEAVARWGAMPE